MATAAPNIDDEPVQPLVKLTEALMNAGAAIEAPPVAAPLPEGEPVPEPPLAKAPGPVVTRTTSLYNKLDMELVEASDFIADIERQVEEEQTDLAAMVAALTKISNSRVKKLMQRRQDAVHERNAVKETMDKLVGKS